MNKKTKLHKLKPLSKKTIKNIDKIIFNTINTTPSASGTSSHTFTMIVPILVPIVFKESVTS